ncbi:hypothetical protein [Bradyrhizobium sp. S69]|uniref:hypothetical protein n=1 Tax=Bradyrhizobium sp. S69 TaxID=1641856 RepID=UPI00131DB4A1|nr:hypothetical protein [Bradyrhizobium sp. S69]
MKAMRFSWIGLILAPLFVPVIFGATMLTLGEGDVLPASLAVLVVGCIVSYGSTILLFLPCLFLLSLEQQMTGFKVCLLGLALGAVEFVSLTLIAWGSRSPDLPIKNYFVYLRLWAADPVTALLPLAGLTTAGLYWWLGKQRTAPSVPVQ